MRHRKAGKRLGRRKEERIALARNLTRSLFLQFGTEREFILTTSTKAKWVKPFAERCITLGVKGYRELQKAADANGGSIADLKKQQTEEKKKFKDFGPKVREHLSKSIHYRREATKRLRDPEAVRQLFDSIAERYLQRPGGYLRVLKTTKVALGDGSPRSLLGFVGGEEGPAKPATSEASS
ncbi:MAG: bL17 family ribosomal protein [Planctomycetota bacterium]